MFHLYKFTNKFNKKNKQMKNNKQLIVILWIGLGNVS